ncbi:Receptor-like protein kinase [Thalictrum thalictroides]|uniref:Receptor-like protein kinase n=1 Tax=Thalictrum thalictroides TaxID=46969 RepID=A0A7J6VTZ6_THATH|nr:Receptor-like protein kinase [Thalictrum thalictroides]
MPKPTSSSPEIPPTVFFFFFFFLFILPFYVVNSQSFNQEQAILLNLKQQWNNPPSLNSWTNTDGSGSHYCNWTGVVCTNGFVTEISLSNINITNKIPQSICQLQNLTHIDLSYNYIPGEFPIVLYNCSKLQYLDLSQNYFVGPIPSDIDRISTLQSLNLGANNFSGDIPASIGNLTELRKLFLFQNQFKGTFPAEIGNLLNLVELGLAFNQFVPSTIPKEFGKLKNLLYLWMADTNLIGEIPIEIGDLANLEKLDLPTNNLTGRIPDNLFLLKNLSVFYLFGNKLFGEIPRKIETLNLVEIDLSMNQLNGTIPEDFGKCQYLKYFDMYNNSLSGEIPASIGWLPNLIGTRLFINNLSGILPPEFGRHSKLEDFQVSLNQFNGSLPDGLCANGVLTGLIAFSNNLTGGLPGSLENCNSLKYVQLYNNNFSGQVPPGFWSLTNLSTVIINDNSFSGELPDKLSWNLSRIEMHNNEFFGRIPSKINASANLMVLRASNNQFSGDIPVELTALRQLETLSFDRNRLSGEIPASILSWATLSSLNLSWNQLSGEIPTAFGSLLDLNQLDLSNNQLSGAVPPQIGRLKLTFLNLSSNQLTGRIPIEFANSAYENSFFNNTGLCLSNSDRRCISETRDSSRLPVRFIAMILVLSGAALLMIVLSAFFVIKNYCKREHGDDLSSYKLTSFQRLDFTESNILSKLTENNLIGSGGSGKVYCVDVTRSHNYVAVKKIWSKGKLDQKLEKEFEAEVEILGTLRHLNIVKLLCCISNGKSKLLVYEYMENRSLDRWLHGKRRGALAFNAIHHAVLDWPRRMNIAVGAAQGLCHMHHNCNPSIIHRDVKSSNILLDSEFNAKIADFGLAKILAKTGESEIMSAVAGSFGYMAPEYAHTTKVNEKIDVYSFGVVLLELVTGREAKEGDEHTCLAEWAWRHYQEDKAIESALDEEVKEPCYLDEMSMVFKLGLMCTGTLPSNRPSMKEVMQILLRNGSSQSYREKKVQTENDDAPLLNVTSDYLAGNKGSQKKTSLG